MDRRFGFSLIAEVKPASPSGWKSKYSWLELFELASSSPADMISIHTDPRWEGSLELVEYASQHTPKAILAKGIHAEDEMISAAIEAGATYALVVGRIPKVYLSRCFLEPYSLAQLRTMPPGSKVVWNSRDLMDLSVEKFKPHTFAEARAIWPGLLIQASNIQTEADIHPEADGAIVGKSLPEFLSTYRSPMAAGA